MDIARKRILTLKVGCRRTNEIFSNGMNAFSSLNMCIINVMENKTMTEFLGDHWCEENLKYVAPKSNYMKYWLVQFVSKWTDHG